MASRMYADRHTHVSCNAVTLVWGSLRLAPIIMISYDNYPFQPCTIGKRAAYVL